MADTFALQLAKFAEKAEGNAVQVVRAVSIDLLTRIVLRSPVGNPSLWKGKAPKGYVGGRLRANWNTRLGGPDLSTTTAVDKSGQNTISTGSAIIGGADGQQDIYIMNSLPYVREIEYEGHSKQAPAGMVRVTVTEFQTYVDNAVKALPQ
ncbi:hypothetical protein [Lysobacter enzymogenes]|uniref:hypothetical protein n=1 Tax=Lysobacter enzymogenes TaxID=69 RepID=UPI001A95E837|nr:hypothetical protein [Lysobacter enzymogenes]QQP96546.1 hypothetical protein JHW38_00360 [Lysobacter enzymogenes]